MHSGLTIAGVSEKDTHPTVTNYHKFGKKYWDDTHTNGSKIGYHFAYYFQKKFVYIHKIIDIKPPGQRPTCMDWVSERQILCLSEPLKVFTWDQWVNGLGRNAPYTSNYRMIPTRAWSYNTLQQHEKFKAFDFIQFKDIVDAPTQMIEVERVEELIRNAKAKKAIRQSNEMELLRMAKCNQLQVLIEDMEEKIKSLTIKQLEVRSGKLDKELV
jgi:hypothetical protein